MSLAFEIGIISLGVLAHVLAIAGVILSLTKKRPETTLRFCWAGLGTILILLLAAWFAYRSGLSVVPECVSAASPANKFTVQQAMIFVAMKPLTYAGFGVAIPILLNGFLLFRGLTLPSKDQQAGAAIAPSIPTTLCIGVGLGLLCSSLLSYLDFDFFLFTLSAWLV